MSIVFVLYLFNRTYDKFIVQLFINLKNLCERYLQLLIFFLWSRYLILLALSVLRRKMLHRPWVPLLQLVYLWVLLKLSPRIWSVLLLWIFYLVFTFHSSRIKFLRGFSYCWLYSQYLWKEYFSDWYQLCLN